MALALTALVPSQAALGDPAFTLYVRGVGFTPSSVIVWNGGDEPTEFLATDVLTTGIDMSSATTPVILPVYVKDGQDVSNALNFVLASAPAPGCPITIDDLAAELGNAPVANDPRAQESVNASCALVLNDVGWRGWPEAGQVPAPLKRALVGLAVDLYRAPSTAFGYYVNDAGFASTGIDQLRRWRYLIDPYRSSWGLA